MTSTLTSPAVDYDDPESVPAAERAQSLLGCRVEARVHGPMDNHPIAGTLAAWDYDRGVVCWVDTGTGLIDCWVCDISAIPARPSTGAERGEA